MHLNLLKYPIFISWGAHRKQKYEENALRVIKMKNEDRRIYIQSNGVMGVYNKNKKLLAINTVEKSEEVDVSLFCNEEECHILIWAFQFPIPYYFTNKKYNSSTDYEYTKGFFEVYWANKYYNFFNGKIPQTLSDFFIEKNDNCKLVSEKTLIVDDNLYVTDDLLSRIIKKDHSLYMSHYLPFEQLPFKTSLLSKDVLKQHQNFVFFEKMRISCNSEKSDLIKTFNHSSEYHDDLRKCEFITDSLNEVKWSIKQFKNIEYAVFSDMPDCEFTHEDEHWYGLDKCHTTTVKYLVKNGSVICIEYHVDVF